MVSILSGTSTMALLVICADVKKKLWSLMRRQMKIPLLEICQKYKLNKNIQLYEFM